MPAPPQKRTTFITFSTSRSKDGYLRDRHNKAAAPFADVLHLLHNLDCQIPGQDHDIVWFGFTDPVGMINRDMSTRKESPLFIRAAIDGVFDQVLSDAAVM